VLHASVGKWASRLFGGRFSGLKCSRDVGTPSREVRASHCAEDVGYYFQPTVAETKKAACREEVPGRYIGTYESLLVDDFSGIDPL
jgi:hypothetical protein